MSLMNIQTVSTELSGKPLIIETGRLAKQAHGSVLVKYGDTHVLVTACRSSGASDRDFFPLTVEYSEKFYASGKIPGSFNRREGRPSSEATLAARLIDRPIRPLFPDGYMNETQIAATVMSLDPDCDPEVAASIGTSAALSISDIPFNGPTAAVNVGRMNGEYVINPTFSDRKEGKTDLDIFVAGTENAIMMVEGGAQEVPEDEVLGAILRGHEEIKRICKVIKELTAKAGKPKLELKPTKLDSDVVSLVEKQAKSALQDALRIREKADRYSRMDEIKASTLETVIPESLKSQDPEKAASNEKMAKLAFDNLKYNAMRSMILDEGVRIDGRNLTTVRPIEVEAGPLPRAHGSGLFTRGETQVMSVVTLGTKLDEQIIDSIFEHTMRRFMLHYNFPPFSVGEAGRMGFTSRREIGHGNLAERSIKAMMPKFENFPYTIRIVCETLESNGSSSMGSVCSTSMALMDAGVPYPKPVAGIAMGLIKEGERTAILTDILGDEDHLGDMDFKVAGTKDGITGIQMDIKIEGVSEEILRVALKQAYEGRTHILGEMAHAIQAPRDDLSQHAPRITTIKVPVDKIREIIGPGGKVIQEIVAKTGAKIDIDDDGTVKVASSDGDSAQAAIEWIQSIVRVPELNEIYDGIVKRIVDFGAFVEVMPNHEGLLHISEIAYERVNEVEDYFKEGDTVQVKVIEIDKSGKVRLSHKVLLEKPEGYEERPRRERTDRDRNDRGRSGGGARRPRRD